MGAIQNAMTGLANTALGVGTAGKMVNGQAEANKISKDQQTIDAVNAADKLNTQFKEANEGLDALDKPYADINQQVADREMDVDTAKAIQQYYSDDVGENPTSGQKSWMTRLEHDVTKAQESLNSTKKQQAAIEQQRTDFATRIKGLADMRDAMKKMNPQIASYLNSQGSSWEKVGSKE